MKRTAATLVIFFASVVVAYSVATVRITTTAGKNDTTYTYEFIIADTTTTHTFQIFTMGAGNFTVTAKTVLDGVLSGYVRFDSVSVTNGYAKTFTVTNDSLIQLWIPDCPTDSTAYWGAKKFTFNGRIIVTAKSTGNTGTTILAEN